MNKFVSLLRKPDYACGATEASPYRFEETLEYNSCDVKYEYVVENGEGRVVVYPSGSPVKYLKLRFEGAMSFLEKVYGDQYERSGEGAYLEWRSVMLCRKLPWFCYCIGDNRMACYGVKTGCDCFATFMVDTHGVTLVLDLCNGQRGTDLKEPLVACRVVELFGEEGEDPFYVAKRFSGCMCEHPVLPKEPIFGVNNWYWAYGHINYASVLYETDYLMKMTEGCQHRPYMILDDGWQKNRTFDKEAPRYIGGEWEPNIKFRDMAKMADAIHAKGAKCGLWFRPLLVPLQEELPEGVKYNERDNGQVMDPSHPYTLARVEADAAKIRSWGYDLIKHDFTVLDIFGQGLTSENKISHMYRSGYTFYDNTKTTATILKNLYAAVQRGAGEADVIGCNVVGHLAAGIHSVYRVGNDTSGRLFELTARQGINSVMRLPLNGYFYNVDPDCAAFTERVDAKLNLDFLEMCAVTGMTTLASVTPDILNEDELARIKEIYRIADKAEKSFGIKNYANVATPEIFESEDGSERREYNWSEAYHGARLQWNWFD